VVHQLADALRAGAQPVKSTKIFVDQTLNNTTILLDQAVNNQISRHFY
jgi:hypothetical protein